MVIEYRFRKPANLNEPEIEVQKSILEQLAVTKSIIKIQRKSSNKYIVEGGADFEKTYRKYEELAKNIDVLSAEPAIFDDDRAIISLGTKECQLPPYKNEHLLCQAMFKYKVGENVDASTVFEIMKGEDSTFDTKEKRMIKDTVNAINERVDKVLGLQAIFKREQQTLKRLR